MKQIYLDYAATTPVDPLVLKKMQPFFSKKFGNPGSFHDKGKEAKDAMDEARISISKILSCKQEEVIFTSGGTESINMAIKGIAHANKDKGNHIITSKIEHHAVLHVCQFLEKNGCSVTYLPVDKNGLVNPEDVRLAITPKTILVSIMYANNEIGTIEPIKEIGKITKEKGIYFHTDACQAAGALPLNVQNLGVDLLTLNGSKIYGPKGIGLLYVKQGTKITPLIHGGGQEYDQRSGTENVPLIVGFAIALELIQEHMEKENPRIKELRDYLIEGLLNVPKSRLNGDKEKRLPNNANITFLDVEGESILLYLNEKGVYVSTGSACASKSLETSHVLKAIGLPYEAAHGSIRFTLGKYTKKSDIDYVIKIMPPIIKKLKALSPVNLNEEHFK